MRRRCGGIDWLRQSELDTSPRLGILGPYYRTAEGVPQDYVQAHMWFNRGLTNDRSPAKNLVVERDRVADRMTPEQIAEAQRLAREWDAARPR